MSESVVFERSYDHERQEFGLAVRQEDYAAFLAERAQHGSEEGFKPHVIPDHLYDFQRHLVEWAVRRGRAAMFADCGLGKTPMQLAWAENVVRETGGRVLVLTPLAVAHQTVGEAEKFGTEGCYRSHEGEIADGARIVVINYERLHYLSPADFAGVVLDESSILKSFDGARRAEITEFMRTIPYRLLCTATAAPNDYIELGTSAEALGEMGHMDMLGAFFTNAEGNSSHRGRQGFNRYMPARVMNGRRWRFKGHAEEPFWRWVCGWARACRKPSDLGYDDGRFQLPPLRERDHVVETATLPDGALFPLPATNFREEREERRRSIQERCEKAAELVNDTGEPAVVWCHLNDEGDLLECLIPDARQVSGRDSDEAKEEAYRAFASGDLRVIVTKPKIGAWGLNWQHCAHVVTFASHSYEQDYQAVRRCWRFGQERPVVVDRIYTEGEKRVRQNLARKAEAADRMFDSLVRHMNDALKIDHSHHFTTPTEVPSWLAPTR